MRVVLPAPKKPEKISIFVMEIASFYILICNNPVNCLYYSILVKSFPAGFVCIPGRGVL